MIRPPPRSTLPYTLFPYPTLFRSVSGGRRQRRRILRQRQQCLYVELHDRPVECFLGGARGLLALGRQYRRRTRGREISHFDRRQESDRRGLFQRHVAQRLAIFRTAADRVRRHPGENQIPAFFLLDTHAIPTEQASKNI